MSMSSRLDCIHPWRLLSQLKYPCRVLDHITKIHHPILDRLISTFTATPHFMGNGFFNDGWGDLSIVQEYHTLLSHTKEDVPYLQKVLWNKKQVWNKKRTMVGWDASFETPLLELKKQLPIESQQCHFQMIVPAAWQQEDDTTKKIPDGNRDRPLVVFLPGTGEQGFVHRRYTLAKPLAEKGIGSVILEGPFYGSRRPPQQMGTRLRQVSDLAMLSRTTVEEARSLLDYFRTQHGYSNIVIAGSSMGGLHAAMVASLTSFPLGLVAWMAPPSAIPAFVDGLLAESCDWNSLSSDEKFKAVKTMMFTQSTDLLGTEDAKSVLGKFLELSNIQSFPKPAHPQAAIIAVAAHDEYIGSVTKEWQETCSAWEGGAIKHLPVGHVSGILFESHRFVKAIEQMIDVNATHPEVINFIKTDQNKNKK